MDVVVAELQTAMVQDLVRRKVVSDERVIEALGTVPRHLFVPNANLTDAYSDRAIPTKWADGVPTSSASQPAIVATMLELLAPPTGGSILEIGAGTGYNAALLASLVGPGGRVVTVEIDDEVADQASANLTEAGIANAEVVQGDGAMGHVAAAPFDGIIVTAGTSDLAPAWVNQLGTEGRLVVPLSILGIQQIVAFERADGHLRSVNVRDGGFMPMVGAMANSDRRCALEDRPGVFVAADVGVEIDTNVISDALHRPRAEISTGISAQPMEVFGSLRRWVAFHEQGAATISYIGPTEGAEASGVSALVELHMPGRVQRFMMSVIGTEGFATIDQARTPSDGADQSIALAVRPYGKARDEANRLIELVRTWDGAGRPGADRLRIEAHCGDAEPSLDPGSAVCRAQHTTFVVYV